MSIILHNESNGLTDVKGFLCAGTGCDIRNKNDLNRLDLALIYSKTPCSVAGVFTTNDVKAAPVQIDKKHLQASKDAAFAIIANSGNANACTGPRGLEDATAMAGATAKHLGIKTEQVFVCSTGRIGDFLPMGKILPGIDQACKGAGDTALHGTNAADAILTSDTKRKAVTVTVDCDGKKVTIAGVAKGAGMIEPNMATMLAFITTDAKIQSDLLQKLLTLAVDESFNAISVDGDMSTNDTVIVLANGVSEIQVIEEDKELCNAFLEGLKKTCRVLADKIVSDGECITKVVELLIEDAVTRESAEAVARAIANSLLVKSSWYGEDPNWGRLTDAAGYARVGVVMEKIDIFYNDVPAVLQGVPQSELKPKWKDVVKNRRFTIRIKLNLGNVSYRFLTTDLSEGYVNFNKGE